MLKIEDAVRVEKYYPPNKKNGGRKNQYIFKCKQCPNEIKIKALSRLSSCTGLCVRCNNARMHEQALDARRLRPFESCWNRVKDSAERRQIVFDLPYEDFLSFVTQHKCHYCLNPIKFSKYGSATYNLDRKSNELGYVKNNLVVCCWRCNKGKRELFTYEEWFGMTEYFRRKL